MKESYNRDPLVAAAEAMMLTEDVAKIKNKVAQLEVGDKTNYGTVVAIGSDSITFKAKDTPKTKIAFRQRKMGRPDYLLMNLVKLTPDGKKVDKTFKESNEFVGAAAAAKVAGEDEFEFEGEKFPTTIGLAIAKKIVGEGKDLDESNEFVGAAAAAKVAGEDEFEFEGEKFPTTIGLAVAKKIIGESFSIKEQSENSLKNSLAILSKNGISGRVSDMQKLAKVIHKNYKAITGKDYEDSEAVATSEIIADLIIHLKVNPDKFISAWDKTIKEGVELEEANDLTEAVKKIACMECDEVSTAAAWKKNGGFCPKCKVSSRGVAESVELEERAGEEWFSAETHIKSSGQLYSSFYVQAKDLSAAKKKADNVFIELLKTSYPKDWPSYQKKFTLKVMKGDNLGDIFP